MTPQTMTRPRSRTPLAERRAKEIEAIFAKYPTKQSGVLPLLWLEQEEARWVSDEAVHEIAELCEVHPSEVIEVTSFYAMFNRQPVGKYIIRVCATLPCALCGADGLLSYLKEKLGVGINEMTPDELFTIKRFECLGACSEAPLMIVDHTIFTRLTRAKVDEVLDRCRKGEDFSGGIVNSNPAASFRVVSENGTRHELKASGREEDPTGGASEKDVEELVEAGEDKPGGKEPGSPEAIIEAEQAKNLETAEEHKEHPGGSAPEAEQRENEERKEGKDGEKD